MPIQVIGSGCPTCKKLHQIVSEVARESGIKQEVEYVPDIQKLIELGAMQSPALVIDGKIALTGYTQDKNKLKELLTQ